MLWPPLHARKRIMMEIWPFGLDADKTNADRKIELYHYNVRRSTRLKAAFTYK